MRDMIEATIRKWRGTEIPSIDSMIKNILTIFASRVSKIIPDWKITESAKKRLQTYLNTKTAKRRANAFVSELIAKIINHKFDKDSRLFIRAIKADLEFLECLQDGTSAGPFLIDDITKDDATLHRLLELDNDLDYIMLDRHDNACAYVKKPGPELLATIAQHEAEAFMSKHGLRADMEAMRLDMHKDYGALMDGVARDAASLGLRL
jgi:hypothetical protein